MDRQATHNWVQIADHANESATTVHYQYCDQCGIVRMTYTHPHGTGGPQFYGAAVDHGTSLDPGCVRFSVVPQPTLQRMLREQRRFTG